MSTTKHFEREADLVAAFCAEINHKNQRLTWTAYHETAGWDVLLVADNGLQIGIEAKLVLNAKALCQAIEGTTRYYASTGPDFRAILVASEGLQGYLSTIARALGVTVISGRTEERGWGEKKIVHRFNPRLPTGELWDDQDWPNWCPSERCKLPDYVPDVTGGKAAPVALTQWKIAAIKLLIVLERRGAVIRGDMAALKLSPTRFTDAYNGFLGKSPNGYVRCGRTPDLKAQHPVNWAQIEADFDKWSKDLPAAQMRLEGVA